MICIQITNSSELIASKVGNFIETLTPDKIDQTIVESKLLEKILENLTNEGIKGRVSLINGIDIKKEEIVINNGLNIIKQKAFWGFLE